MTYDIAWHARIEPRGHDAGAILRSWNEDDALSSYVGEADVHVPDGRGPTLVLATDGQEGMYQEEMRERVVRQSLKFPAAVYRVIREGEDFGDWPDVTYFHAGNYYNVPFQIPEFDASKLRPLEDYDYGED